MHGATLLGRPGPGPHTNRIVQESPLIERTDHPSGIQTIPERETLLLKSPGLRPDRVAIACPARVEKVPQLAELPR